MKTSIRCAATLALMALPLGCAPGDAGPVVARAGDYELSVDQAARLLSGVQGLPNEPEVVEALAELWIDYTLLADAAATDSTFRGLDLGPLVEAQFEQEMVLALRDSVVRPDTTIAEDELRALFDDEAPGQQVRASHILMQVPPQASPAQVDSVRQAMEGIAARIQAGEDFAELARAFSQDPGSGAQGGDLGWFAREDMVRPFSDAAFELDAGQTSGVVQTPFGFHIIRVHEKQVPSFDDLREQFRAQVQDRRYQAAESVYIASVEEAAQVEVTEDAAETIRSLAGDPRQVLPRRAGRRAIARFQGGEYTVREALTFMRTRQPQFLESLAGAPDDAIEDGFIRGLVQRKLLVREARQAGLEPTMAQRDSVGDLVRGQFREIARTIGLHPLEVLGTETRAQAVERVVEARLRAVVIGQAQMIPLAGLSLVLRENEDARVIATGIDQAVQQIARARGPAPAMPTPAPNSPVPDSAAAPAAPDTAGG